VHRPVCPHPDRYCASLETVRGRGRRTQTAQHETHIRRITFWRTSAGWRVRKVIGSFSSRWILANFGRTRKNGDRKKFRALGTSSISSSTICKLRMPRSAAFRQRFSGKSAAPCPGKRRRRRSVRHSGGPQPEYGAVLPLHVDQAYRPRQCPTMHGSAHIVLNAEFDSGRLKRKPGQTL
jgi:hypothetical protein